MSVGRGGEGRGEQERRGKGRGGRGGESRAGLNSQALLLVSGGKCVCKYVWRQVQPYLLRNLLCGRQKTKPNQH